MLKALYLLLTVLGYIAAAALVAPVALIVLLSKGYRALELRAVYGGDTKARDKAEWRTR